MVPLKKVIKKSFQHKGFSVVEVISNCHINLGRKNKLKNPISMAKWIAEKTVTQSQHEKLPAEMKKLKYPVGIFTEDKDRLEYSDLYYQHIIPAAKAISQPD